MKYLVSSLILLCSAFGVFAQPQTGTTEFNKVPQSSLLYELPYSEAVMISALESKMKDYGKLPKKSKGLYKYKNIVIPEISSKPIIVYFSIDRKSKKDKENSILSMLIANENDILFKQDEDADIFQRGKAFLQDFSQNTAVAKHQQDVGDQANELKKAEKKLENLKGDASSLAKKLKKIQEDISDNEIAISKQEQEVAAQKKKLEEIENKQP